MKPISDAILEKILDPEFPLEGLEWDTLARIVSDVVQTRERHQYVLGRIAYSMTQQYGDQAMTKLSQSIEDSTGRKFPIGTLMKLRWIYDRLHTLDIPADLPFYAHAILAGTEDPAAWLKKIVDNGWSGAQFAREVKIAKGEDVTKKTIVCPKCHYSWQV